MLVLDASVAIKWYLDDEDHVAEAEAVLDLYRQGRVRLIAPDHIRFEVANAIRTAVRIGRVTAEQGSQAIRDFLEWRIPTVGSDTLLLYGYDYALRFDCALYDGLYLALADMTGIALVHADRRLQNSLAGRFPSAIWIADYSLPRQ